MHSLNIHFFGPCFVPPPDQPAMALAPRIELKHNHDDRTHDITITITITSSSSSSSSAPFSRQNDIAPDFAPSGVLALLMSQIFVFFGLMVVFKCYRH